MVMIFNVNITVKFLILNCAAAIFPVVVVIIIIIIVIIFPTYSMYRFDVHCVPCYRPSFVCF